MLLVNLTASRHSRLQLYTAKNGHAILIGNWNITVLSPVSYTVLISTTDY